jgi:drug/metabolite transporter (DMT)-like permease
MNRHSLTGAAFAVTAALLFGSAIPSSKALLGDLDVFLLTGLLYGGSAIGLAAAGPLLRRWRLIEGAPMRRGDWPWVAGSIVVGGLAAPLLLLLGLDLAPASTASLLMNFEAPLTAVFAALVFGEHVGRRVIVGIAAITTGAALISGQGSADSGGWLGPLVVVGSAASWALDNNIVRRIAHTDPVRLAILRASVATVLYLSIAFAAGHSLPALPVLGQCMLLGLFGYGVALTLFFLSLRHIGAARAAAFFAAGPFIGATGGIVALGEPLTAAFAAAAVCMALGIWLVLGGGAAPSENA